MSSSTPPSANPPCQQYWSCPPQHLPQRILPVNSLGDVPLNISLSESARSTVLEMSPSTPPSANPPCQQSWRCPPQHLPQRILPVNSIGDVPLSTSLSTPLSESSLSTVLEMSPLAPPSANPPCQQSWRCPPQHLPQRIRPLNSLGENQPCQQSLRCPPSTPPSAKSALSTHSLTGQACRERAEPFVCPAFVSCRWPVCRLMEWHTLC